MMPNFLPIGTLPNLGGGSRRFLIGFFEIDLS